MPETLWILMSESLAGRYEPTMFVYASKAEADNRRRLELDTFGVDLGEPVAYTRSPANSAAG